jgi:hypothetical protein
VGSTVPPPATALFKQRTATKERDNVEHINKKWRLTKADARRDIHAALIRHIGKLQAEADKMADEILHDDLTTEEVTRGVA